MHKPFGFVHIVRKQSFALLAPVTPNEVNVVNEVRCYLSIVLRSNTMRPLASYEVTRLLANYEVIRLSN